MTNVRYRAAIIGCGRVAWILDKDPLKLYKPCSHAGAYEAVDRIEIVAGADTDNERLKAFSEEYGVGGIYTDYREMLHKEHPDIVSICAYATDRFSMVRECIESGVKGIWCEKALATSMEEADEIVKMCSQSNTKLIVSHMRRWEFVYIHARQAILDGKIGIPVSVVSHFSGNMIHTGTHAFDILRFLFGDIRWVQADLEYDGTVSHHKSFESTEGLVSGDPGGYALVCFEDDLYATVHGDSRGYFMFEFDIMGTEGRIRIGNGLYELYQARESRTESGLVQLYIEDSAVPEMNNAWITAAEHLVDCMENNNVCTSNAEDGRAALEVALALHQSHIDGGTRTYLPLKNTTLKVLSR